MLAHISSPNIIGFPGEQPFEAVESKRFSDWVAKMKEESLDFIGYLDFHSYSQQSKIFDSSILSRKAN